MFASKFTEFATITVHFVNNLYFARTLFHLTLHNNGGEGHHKTSQTRFLVR